jgi:hypothetical protein
MAARLTKTLIMVRERRTLTGPDTAAAADGDERRTPERT